VGLPPVAVPSQRLPERVTPARAPTATRFLAPVVAPVAPVAMAAARRAVAEILAEAARAAGAVAGGERPERPGELKEAAAAVVEVRRFIHRMARSEQAS